MPAVELSPPTLDDLSLLARAWQVDHDTAVQRLIAAFRDNGRRLAQPDVAEAGGPDPGWLPVYADYGGVRVTGEYDPRTHAVRLTSGPIRGTFKSPSGAAVAVVSELNPMVDPNRNGWSFWNLAENGRTLQQVRRRKQP